MTNGISEADDMKKWDVWDVFCENNDLLLENDQLKAENAKLRQLVWDMVDYGEGAGNGMAGMFADRCSELGIEVNA